MRQKLFLAIVLPFVLSLVGCQTKSSDRPRASNGGDEGSDADEEVTYEGWVKGFVNTNCAASCHNANAEDGSPDLTTYAKVYVKKTKMLARMKLTSGSKKMPPGKTLKDEQIEKFEAWLNAKPKAAPEGKKSGSGKAKTTVISYNGWVKGYEEDNCAKSGCHVSGKQAPELDSYEKSKASATASRDSLKDNMPLGNAKHDEAIIAKYDAWIKLGMPENDSDVDTGNDTGSDTGTGTGTDTGGSAEAKAAGWALIKKTDGTGCLIAGSGCHNAGSTSPDLSTEEKAIAAKSQVLSAAVTRATMPQGNPYSSDNKKIIQDWYDSL